VRHFFYFPQRSFAPSIPRLLSLARFAAQGEEDFGPKGIPKSAPIEMERRPVFSTSYSQSGLFECTD